jgi:CHAT domain-containing protein
VEALEIAQELKQYAEEATRMGNLAGIYVDMDEFEMARDLYLQARAIEKELGDPSGEVNALNNLGSIEYALGNDEAALAFLEDALPLARDSNNPILLSSVLANAGKVYLALGENELALAAVEEALPLVDAVRSVAGSEAGRAGFAERFSELYSTAVALYHTLGRDEDAFVVSEQARARAFLDALATGEVQLSDEVAATLLAEQRELYAQWLAAQDELAVVAALDPPDAEVLAQAEATLAEVEKAYQEVLATIENEVGKLSELIPGRSQILGIEAVQQLLDEQTTLLSFHVMPEDAGTLAFVLTQSGFQVIDLPDATGEGLRDALSDLTLWLDLSDPHPQPLIDIYQWLVKPLLPYLNTQRVGIVPHQMLHYMPLAALSDGASYFGDQHLLFLLPSASALPYINANLADNSEASTEDVPEQALVYGNPASDAGLSLLVYAEEEANAISTLLAAPVHTGSGASETLLRDQATHSQILHLAAHGNYNQDNPLYSAIYLAPDSESDGRLEVHEVYGLDLTANHLVVLSACETSLGQLSGGDELVGLTRAFFFAGAPTVIASLWSVDDLATKDLMLAYYTGLQTGLDKATALQAAQAQIRAQYPSPYYWAAFVLNGDPGFGGTSGLPEGSHGGTSMAPPLDPEPAAPEAEGSSGRGGNSTTPAPTQANGNWVQSAVEQIGRIWK